MWLGYLSGFDYALQYEYSLVGHAEIFDFDAYRSSPLFASPLQFHDLLWLQSGIVSDCEIPNQMSTFDLHLFAHIKSLLTEIYCFCRSAEATEATDLLPFPAKISNLFMIRVEVSLIKRSHQTMQAWYKLRSLGLMLQILYILINDAEIGKTDPSSVLKCISDKDIVSLGLDIANVWHASALKMLTSTDVTDTCQTRHVESGVMAIYEQGWRLRTSTGALFRDLQYDAWNSLMMSTCIHLDAVYVQCVQYEEKRYGQSQLHFFNFALKWKL